MVLEHFVNRLTDMDWGWWPFLHLRPNRDQDIDDRLLARMSLYYGSTYGAVLAGYFALHGTGPFTFWHFVRVVVFFMVAFFVFYRITFAYYWNRRAARLRARAGSGSET